jgi:fido (protein-threonine AMPylation protein)
MANTQYQISHAIFTADELAVRFHHQLVWIHPFPNGNGRHARLLADNLALRHQYLEALRAADAGEYEQLLAFARC